MGQKGTARAIRAMERHLQRESQRRQRELARLEKEKAKLSAIEQGRLEVETYENRLDVLLSVHKEPCEEWDWIDLASTLPGPKPVNNRHNELRAKQVAMVAGPNSQEQSKLIEQATFIDDREFHEANAAYLEEKSGIKKLRELALRILSAESMAYIEAFAEFNPVAEISTVGALKQFAVENKDLIECVFKVNAKDAIPAEVKALTASGKVSCKTMPKSQYHEIYQDYICACVIRMAREVFAMLPVGIILVTAQADVVDSVSGEVSDQAVLSVAIPRTALAGLNYNDVSAAQIIDSLVHRGNFKGSRAGGAFRAIAPLAPGDLAGIQADEPVPDLCCKISRLRDAIRGESIRMAKSTPSTVF